MNEFRYLDYYTKYSCNGSTNVNLAERVCFMEVFSRLRNKTKYTEHYIVYIYNGTAYGSANKKSNMCLITRDQLSNHIKQAKRIVPFTFRIVSTYEGDLNIYKVHLHLKKVQGIYHKYLLSWLRYTYEFPFNVMLLDALRLKNNSIFRFTSIATLFNIVYSAYPENIRYVHSIVSRRNVRIDTAKQVKNNLRKVDCLNDTYAISLVDVDDLKIIEKQCGKYSLRDVQFWNDDSFSKYREQIYIDNYKLLK